MAQLEMEWETVENLLISLLDEQIKWYEGAVEEGHSMDSVDPKLAKRLVKNMKKVRADLSPRYYIKN